MGDDLAKQLRREIAASGLSGYQLAKETKIPAPTITRFLAGADMKLSTASKLAKRLRLHLTNR